MKTVMEKVSAAGEVARRLAKDKETAVKTRKQRRKEGIQIEPLLYRNVSVSGFESHRDRRTSIRNRCCEQRSKIGGSGKRKGVP